jgi:two-component system cell cycle response regulator CpdR
LDVIETLHLCDDRHGWKRRVGDRCSIVRLFFRIGYDLHAPYRASTRELIASMLEELGCETLTARSATDALGQLASDESIDMLFADVNMSGLSGRELAERARDFRPQLRVLLVLGLESEGRGFPLLRKPFTQSDLRRVMADTTGLCED